MAGKPYREMTNEELGDEAARIAYCRKRAGEQHANLLYALAFRLREIEGQDAAPVRCRTLEEVTSSRGLSREARAHLLHRDGVARREQDLRREFVLDQAAGGAQ